MIKFTHLLFLITCLSLFIGCNRNEERINPTQFEDKTSFQVQKTETTDSINSIYWVNRAFAICLGKGISPCQCLSENEIAMVQFKNNQRKVVIQSSVHHFGMETSAEFDYSMNPNREMIVKETFPLKDQLIISKPEKLHIQYNGEELQFEKYLYPQIHPSARLDLFEQRNKFMVRSLLRYSKTSDSDSTTLFYSFNELTQLISDGRVSLSCSDDYRFDGMMISGDTSRHFHLDFGNNCITLYDEGQGREKGELLDLSTLDKQIFYLDK